MPIYGNLDENLEKIGLVEGIVELEMDKRFNKLTKSFYQNCYNCNESNMVQTVDRVMNKSHCSFHPSKYRSEVESDENGKLGWFKGLENIFACGSPRFGPPPPLSGVDPKQK